MSLTPSLNLDYRMMNEKHVTFLIKQIRYYLDELEGEIRNHPEHYVMTDKDYEQVKYFYSHVHDDDGWTD